MAHRMKCDVDYIDDDDDGKANTFQLLHQRIPLVAYYFSFYLMFVSVSMCPTSSDADAYFPFHKYHLWRHFTRIFCTHCSDMVTLGIKNVTWSGVSRFALSKSRIIGTSCHDISRNRCYSMRWWFRSYSIHTHTRAQFFSIITGGHSIPWSSSAKSNWNSKNKFVISDNNSPYTSNVMTIKLKLSNNSAHQLNHFIFYYYYLMERSSSEALMQFIGCWRSVNFSLPFSTCFPIFICNFFNFIYSSSSL